MNAQYIEDMLTYWQENNTFEKSIASRSEKMPFKFYDGPPFTSGDPHYGHLMQSVVKDMIPRWMTMRGYQVKRKRGRDCHGIPAENFVNKQLGITSRKQVEEEYGIKEYVEQCRSMVNTVNDNWKWFVDHVGRWVDMENAYFTMDNTFMESVIHLFSDLYHNNLIYKGFKVLGYSRSLGTALSNSEIAEGYEMRQDPAVTVTLPFERRTGLEQLQADYRMTDDGCIEVVAGILERDGKYLMIHHTKENLRFFPGGKVHADEYPVDALRREYKEETGMEITSETFLGHVKTIHQGVVYRLHYFSIEATGEAQIQEDEKHGDMKWVKPVESEDDLGFVISIDDVLVSDPEEIQRTFIDLYYLHTGLIGTDGLSEGAINFLARTTTPWTLPSNMFLAVHKDITYVVIFDLEEKQYYVVAEKLLHSYYKSDNDRAFIFRLKGDELLGLEYTPLFDYYHNHPEIEQQYKDKVHRILAADFVTAESGTGIAHEAPAFGEDDYQLVSTYFPREKAQEWLFDPVDSYGDFTELVPEWKGVNVIEANKSIISHLKQKGRVAKLETIDHSYPHCPRTGEPLIYKAIESWFVKEDHLKGQTVPSVESIHFVPESVKKRFSNGLASAPDWNISRTRFWGCPLPVRESEDGAERVVLGSLEELYQHNKNHKQLTKIILMRHGRTDYNEQHRHDHEGHAVLNDVRHVQAKDMATQLASHGIDAIYSSPLQRCQDTVGYLAEAVGKEIHIDERIKEICVPAYQGKEFDCTKIVWKDNAPILGDTDAESIQDVFARVQSFFHDIMEEHAGETVVICSHGDPLVLMRKVLGDFDYDTKKYTRYISNNPTDGALPYEIEYVNNSLKQRMDLHRPYIDDIVVTNPATGNDLQRIPEVLDCWFESGSMPYGQDHYMKNRTLNDKRGNEFESCADFIAEGLDQTRGWFRSLHVLGHAYNQKNTFDNVVVTGMILAEDGKKMSKRLKNYPDPSYLLNQYGADALRLYFLGSPVVRSEPLRFSEKGVEQLLKDFVIPLQNVINFLTTYADIDEWKHTGTQITLMRHAEADYSEETGYTKETELTQEGRQSLYTKEFAEKILRIQPDVLISSEFVRAQQTAEGVQDVLKVYLDRDIQIHTDKRFGIGFDEHKIEEILQDIKQKFAGKKVLIVTHKGRLRQLLASQFTGNLGYHREERFGMDYLETCLLPGHSLKNELDQRLYAELYATLEQLDANLAGYHLESATKELLGFVEKLTNRWLRRSRRRFWEEGMSDDKHAAYSTLFEVTSLYLKMAAPFTPFIAEKLWQTLGGHTMQGDNDSVHLQYRPLGCRASVNQQLLEEITTVRKIIKGAMYIRAKQQIKVKQPLQHLRFGL